MKMLTYFHQGNEISVQNNLLGIESVRYNDIKMTSQFSFFGSTHDFSVIEEDIEVNYQIKISLSIMVGVTFSIWRNGQALLLGSGCHQSKKVSTLDNEYV